MAACKPQEEIVIKDNVFVVNIKDSSDYNGDAFIYSLPKTELSIQVEITKTVVKRGPFYQYADQYLGIKEVAMFDKISYKISDVKIFAGSIPDPDHFYRVETEGNSAAGFLSLDENGIIMAVNRLQDENKRLATTDVFLNNSKITDVDYSDLTLEPNLGTQIDTIFKTVKTDTSFIQIPILKNQIGSKSLSKQAEEAANFILKLRKRRFYLMTGKYGDVPEGEALKTVLVELDKLEKQYLSLFVGLNTNVKEEQVFEYLPLSDVTVDRDVLFNFSENSGLLRKGDAEGDQISINIRSLGGLNYVKSYTGKLNNNNDNSSGLIYRLPDMAKVEIMSSNKVIASKKIVICQFGTILTMPEDMLKGNKYSIEFYPETGGVKSIRRIIR